MRKILPFILLAFLLAVPLVAADNNQINMTSGAQAIVTVTHADGSVTPAQQTSTDDLTDLIYGLILIFFIAVGILTTFAVFPWWLWNRFHKSSIKSTEDKN